MTANGLDYGNPLAQAVNTYTTLQNSALQRDEFESRKAMLAREDQRQQETHDQQQKERTDAEKSRELAAVQMEIQAHLDADGPGGLPLELLDRAMIIDPSLSAFNDVKYAQKRKFEIDNAMQAFGDLVAPMQATQQAAIANPIQESDGPMTPLPQVQQTSQALPTAIRSLSNVERRRSPILPAPAQAVPANEEYASQVAAKNQLLASVTNLFKDRLMAGKLDDGNPPKDARIIDFIPSPDGTAAALQAEFTRQDGSTYTAPITENRTADPRDPVRFIPVKAFVNRLATERALITSIEAARARYGDKEVIARMDKLTAENRQRKATLERNKPVIEQLRQQAIQLRTSGDEYGANKAEMAAAAIETGDSGKELAPLLQFGIREPKEAAIHTSTNITKAPQGAKDSQGNPVKAGTLVYMTTKGDKTTYDPAYIKPERGDGRGSSSRLPADAQMVEYLVASGIAPDRKTAYGVVKRSRENPVEVISKLATAAMKAQAAAYIKPGDPGYKTADEIIADARSMVEKVSATGEPSAIMTAKPSIADTQDVFSSSLIPLLKYRNGVEGAPSAITSPRPDSEDRNRTHTPKTTKQSKVPLKPAPGPPMKTKIVNNKPYLKDSTGQWFEADDL